MNPGYKRVLLKVSGEALKGDSVEKAVRVAIVDASRAIFEGKMPAGKALLKARDEILAAIKGNKEALSPERLDYVTDEICKLYEMGVQIAVVVGAGNISRGTLGKRWGIEPVEADVNGMIATMVNAGWIASVLRKKLGEERVRKMISLPASYCGEMYSPEKARNYLDNNKIVVIGGGNGISLCTTDSAAVQRALELRVNSVLMLKNGVDGVYEEDPKKDPKAKRYKCVTFNDFKKFSSGIADETAAITAARYEMPMHFIDFEQPGTMEEICKGNFIGTYVGNCEKTEFYDE